MLTREDVLNANEFHANGCNRIVGPRGGVTIRQTVYRRNGATQTWKTRPDAFSVPVKHGLYACTRITNKGSWSPVVNGWHTADDCPLFHTGCE